jgi:hypothetical protein
MTILDKETKLDDSVTRPSYYGGPASTFEPVKVIHDAGLGPGFYLGSALKYLQRAEHKGEMTKDLTKSRWYLSAAIELGYAVPGLASMDAQAVVEAWAISNAHLRGAAFLILRNELSEALAEMDKYFRSVEAERGTR